MRLPAAPLPSRSMSADSTCAVGKRPAGRRAVTGAAAVVLVAAGALLWSKWAPYTAKVFDLSGNRAWTGGEVLRSGGVAAGDPPSLAAAVSFATDYAQAVWKALLAALVISAALHAWLPERWAARVLNRRRPVPEAIAGGLLSTPSMMCTCCSAPVAVTLRRSGASLAAAGAYWLGNPLLNPAVLIFLHLVAPWQWTLTRLLVGAALVVSGGVLAHRLGGNDRPRPRPVERRGGGFGAAVRRFGRQLLRLVLTLVPEYLLVVMLLGAFRGWLLAGVEALPQGALAVGVAAVIGTALVLPTAAEIPVLQALALAGASPALIGALLVTLPAVSLPGMVVVARSFGPRATAVLALTTVVGGVVAGGVLAVL